MSAKGDNWQVRSESWRCPATDEWEVRTDVVRGYEIICEVHDEDDPLTPFLISAAPDMKRLLLKILESDPGGFREEIERVIAKSEGEPQIDDDKEIGRL